MYSDQEDYADEVHSAEVGAAKYEFTEIVCPEVRIISNTLELWFRVKWNNTKRTTIEPETSFDRHILQEYVARHRVRIRNIVVAAESINPTLGLVESLFRETWNNDEGGDEEQDGDGCPSGPDKRGVSKLVLQRTEGGITLQKDVDVNAKGTILWNVTEIGDYFGIVVNEHVEIGLGAYMAYLTRGGYFYDLAVLATGVSLNVNGTPISEPHRIDHGMVQEDDSMQQWPFTFKANSFGSEHLDRVYAYLAKGMKPSFGSAGQRRNFVVNTKKRYVIQDRKLMYRCSRRKVANIARRLQRASICYLQVPTQTEAWRIVQTDHLQKHDGHNRAETRLGSRYMIPHLREMALRARVGCQTCETFEKPTKNVTTPIITTRPMQLVMFDLFKLPFEDAEG